MRRGEALGTREAVYRKSAEGRQEGVREEEAFLGDIRRATPL